MVIASFTGLSQPIHLPFSEAISLKSIVMLSFHHLPVFRIKVFQQISSPKFRVHSPEQYISKAISFLKTEAVSSIPSAMTAPSLTLMPVITCPAPSVPASSLHARWPQESSTHLLHTQQFARRVSELLQWRRSGCSQAVWQRERQRTSAVQWDTLRLRCALFNYIIHKNSVPTSQ
jgi:hypothetical protein